MSVTKKPIHLRCNWCDARAEGITPTQLDELVASGEWLHVAEIEDDPTPEDTDTHYGNCAKCAERMKRNVERMQTHWIILKCLQCFREFVWLDPEGLGQLIVKREVDGVTHYQTEDQSGSDEYDEDFSLEWETHHCECCSRCNKERCPGPTLF